jgi:RNA recognition motif-containing protein
MEKRGAADDGDGGNSKRQRVSVESSRVVFFRNVPNDITELEIMTLCQLFGGVSIFLLFLSIFKSFFLLFFILRAHVTQTDNYIIIDIYACIQVVGVFIVRQKGQAFVEFDSETAAATFIAQFQVIPCALRFASLYFGFDVFCV